MSPTATHAPRVPSRARLLIAAGFVGFSLAIASFGPVAAVSPNKETAIVSGEVVTWETGRPVAGATVTLPQFGVQARTDGTGRFSFSEPVRPGTAHRRITAVATAPGWGRWTILRAPLVPGQTLELHAELRRTAYTHTVRIATDGDTLPRKQAPASNYTDTCTGWIYAKVPPSTIKVWITDDAKAKKYDFDFYLAHVLPNEWIASWDADALGAGAIAAKTYAWYRAESGHAYSGGSGCADLTDTTSDQVFDPSWSNSATDQAVYATLGSVAHESGAIFLAQYWSGAPDDPCKYETGQFEGRMNQWATQTCATQGKLWGQITTVFYPDATWTTDEYQNLLLNPSVESAATYGWIITGSTVATRVKGNSYDGSWHYDVAPTAPGKTATLRQERPFNGTSSTKYHAWGALKCPTGNATKCTITMKVIAVPASGGSVAKSMTIVEKNDGVWRLYEFDPAAAGITHAAVWLSFVTQQTIWVDLATLHGPFGGH